MCGLRSSQELPAFPRIVQGSFSVFTSPIKLPHSHLQQTILIIHTYRACVSVRHAVTISEVAATSAAVSRLPAIHPAPRHLCLRFVSRRAFSASKIHWRPSTTYLQYMQMLQIIVYEEPIPSRLLLNHHSTRTAVPAWRCNSPRLAFSKLRPAAGNLGVSHKQFPPSPELRAEALEDEEAMAQTRQRRVDSFSRRQEVQACGGSHSPASVADPWYAQRICAHGRSW
jgi:hypothetical protein